MARIRIGFVKRLRKQRARERAFIHMGSLSQLCELACIGRIEGDVETSGDTGHMSNIHESARYVQEPPGIPRI